MRQSSDFTYRPTGLAAAALVLALFGFAGRGLAAPEDVAPAGVAKPASPEQIAKWVAELNDNRYAHREAAQQALAAARLAALKDVGRVALDGSLEASTRSINILLGWAESTDADLSVGALERIAQLANRPAEAAMAAEKLADIREAVALKEIAALGGVCRDDEQTARDPLKPYLKPPLQIIIGPSWKGSAADLGRLRDVRRASTISFHASAIGDEAVDQLANLSQVRRIEFYGTRISDQSTATIKEKLPNVALEVRSGARLGIAGSGVGGVGGAHVDRVVPGSPAEGAGLQAGDVITSLGETPIQDFAQLTREISKSQPGDSVPLKILRQGNPQEITVKFDGWGSDAALNAPPAIPGQAPGAIVIPMQAPGPGPIAVPRRR